MRFKFRLVHKGLVLLLVPLLLTGTLMFYIHGLMRQMDSEFESHLQSAEILSTAESVMVGCMIAHLAFAVYIAHHNGECQRDHRDATRQMAVMLRQLAKYVQHRPGKGEQLTELMKGVIFTWKSQLQVMQLPSDLTLAMVRSHPPKDMQKDIQTFAGMALVNQIIDEEKLTDGNALDRREAVWRTTEATLVGGVLASLVLTFALAAFFHRNIIGRLRNVRQNIWSISDKASLIKPMPGTDEIADLDSAVHETARQIRELEAYKSRMTRFIAGQLKEPVDVITESIQFATAHGGLNQSGLELTGMSGLSLQRLQRLVADLVNVDALVEGKFELVVAPVSLGQVMRTSAASVAKVAADKQINVEVVELDCTLEADADRLVQVLVNLLGNAIKFSPPNSRVRLLAERAGESITLRVSDEGPGIPESVQDKLFARYFQVSREDATERKGFGLGLFICKSIIEEHGGRIRVESKLGQGTSFIISLPLVHAGPVADTPTLTFQKVHPGLRSWFLFDAPLWQKGLIILLCPLILQIATITSVASLLWQSNQRVERAINAQQTTEVAVDLIRDTIQMGYFAYYYNLFNTQTYKDDYDQAKKTMGQDKGTLLDLQSKGLLTKETLPLFESHIANAEKFSDLLLKTAGQPLTAAQLLPSEEECMKMERSTKAVGKQVNTQIQSQKSLEDLQREQSKQAQKTITWLMVASIVVDLCLAGLLLRFALKGISYRTARLATNARSLLEQKPLSKPEDGSDEIAQIDKAFYAGGTKLLELREFKQQMISIVGHDMRTPLASVMGLFELLLVGAFGKLPDKVMSSCEKGQEQTEQLLQLINEILDVEKKKAIEGIELPGAIVK
jgi:signal transduction histidine kinase